jgi:hypothetical protein
LVKSAPSGGSGGHLARQERRLRPTATSLAVSGSASHSRLLLTSETLITRSEIGDEDKRASGGTLRVEIRQEAQFRTVSSPPQSWSATNASDRGRVNILVYPFHKVPDPPSARQAQMSSHLVRNPNSGIPGLLPGFTSKTSVMAEPSMQPPDTDPRKFVSASITRWLLTGWGADS